jgi:hypothetical protein
MNYLFCFLSGIAFAFIVLLAWSLCRTAKHADELLERIREKDDPC